MKLDAAASDDDIGGALEKLLHTPADELRPQLRTVLKLDANAPDEQVASALITAIEKLEGFETSASAAREKEVDDELATLEMSDEAKKIFRAQMIADPENARVILSAIPKKASAGAAQIVEEAEAPAPGGAGAGAAAPAAAAAKKTPPAPKHDPAAKAEPTQTERLAELDKLIAEIRKTTKFTDYSSAREEARRRKPALFQ